MMLHYRVEPQKPRNFLIVSLYAKSPLPRQKFGISTLPILIKSSKQPSQTEILKVLYL